MDTVSSLFDQCLNCIASVDPEVAMAIVIVVCSIALTFTVDRANRAMAMALTNDGQEHESPSVPPVADDLNDSFGPEGTETYCGSYGSVASTSSFADQEEPNRFTTDDPSSPYDAAAPVGSSPKSRKLIKTPSLKRLLIKLKNKQAARKEASMLKQSRTAIMKNLQRKSFSDHFRSLNPLKRLGRNSNRNLLKTSKSFTFATSSVLDDQSYAEKSV